MENMRGKRGSEAGKEREKEKARIEATERARAKISRDANYYAS